MHDAAHKPYKPRRDLEPSEGYVEPEWNPSVSFDEKQLPEIKNWQVGEEYTIVLKVKQTSSRLQGPDHDQRMAADFDIQQVGALE